MGGGMGMGGYGSYGSGGMMGMGGGYGMGMGGYGMGMGMGMGMGGMGMMGMMPGMGALGEVVQTVGSIVQITQLLGMNANAVSQTLQALVGTCENVGTLLGIVKPRPPPQVGPDGRPLFPQHEQDEDGRRKKGLLKALFAMSSVFFLIYVANKWFKKGGRAGKKLLSPQQLEQIFHATLRARAQKR
jgi:hypothetical protein